MVWFQYWFSNVLDTSLDVGSIMFGTLVPAVLEILALRFHVVPGLLRSAGLKALDLPQLRLCLLIHLSLCDYVRYFVLEGAFMLDALLRGLLACGSSSVLAVDPFAMF
ncbi:hypothetical protein QL285_082592 [Trifolium repens]|nr:hypothetical protein QL285_082592 [Trifolium repens]